MTVESASRRLGLRVILPPVLLASLAILAHLLARGAQPWRTVVAWAGATGAVSVALDLVGTSLVKGAVSRIALASTPNDGIVVSYAEADFPGAGTHIGAALLAVALVALVAARQSR